MGELRFAERLLERLEIFRSPIDQGERGVIVHSDRIEVYAFGFTEGFAATLPKQGKKSVGNANDGYKWQYPLTALDSLKTIGLPILFAIDAER